MRTVKLKDIAEKTGVSVSTVSRILSGDSNRKMKEETIRSVIEAANELGYYENRKMKLKHSMPLIRIAVIFCSDRENMIAPFFAEILEGVRLEIEELASQMRLRHDTMCVYDDDFEEKVKNSWFDVAIVVGRVKAETLEFLHEHISYLLYAGINSVGGMDEVLCDAREGMKSAVGYLYSKGRKNIAYLGPTSIHDDVRNETRYLGYVEGLSSVGINYNPVAVEDTYLSVPDGYSGAERLFSRIQPSAVICANDSVAIGVIRYLKEKRIKCPDEVMVIGFDNIDVSAFIEPSLTTFDVPKKDMGRFAVKFALDRIENPRKANIRITLPYELIERESSRSK